MSIQLFCPDCSDNGAESSITKTPTGWGCEECGYFRPFINGGSVSYPKIEETVHHLTANGKDNLCKGGGPAIHITYAAKQLDSGRWCESCLGIWRERSQ